MSQKLISSMSIGLKTGLEDYGRAIVSELAKIYNFDAERGMRELNLLPKLKKESKKEKKEERKYNRRRKRRKIKKRRETQKRRRIKKRRETQKRSKKSETILHSSLLRTKTRRKMRIHKNESRITDSMLEQCGVKWSMHNMRKERTDIGKD